MLVEITNGIQDVAGLLRRHSDVITVVGEMMLSGRSKVTIMHGKTSKSSVCCGLRRKLNKNGHKGWCL